MKVTVNIPERLEAGARARGVSVEVYVEQVLSRQSLAFTETSSHSAAAAIDRILELRKGNTLNGLRIKDLLHEGHKY